MNEQPARPLTAERRHTIAQLAQQAGGVRVDALAARFGVSPSTIRRDLAWLEARGLVQRGYGGAVAPVEALQSTHVPPVTREARIGRAAAERVADGEAVFLGPGRLTVEVARCLQDHSDLTVITNGLEVAYRVATETEHTLIITGGLVGRGDLGMTGHLAEAVLGELRADRVILELGGISAVDGLTNDSLPQAELARALLALGAEVIILVPGERVGRVAAAYVGPASDADVVITVRETSSAPLWDLSELGIKVVLA